MNKDPYMPGKKIDDCIYEIGEGDSRRLLVRVKYPSGNEATKTFPITAKRAAKAFRDEQWTLRAKGAGRGPGTSKVTFEDYARQWLESKASKAHKTKLLLEGALTNHVFPHIGARPIASIRRSDVQALVNRMNKSLAPVTVRNYHSHLSSVFKSAALDGLIVDTPCKGIELPKNTKGRRSIVPILPEQVEHIVESIDPEWRGAVILAIGSGLRPGELFAITTDRIDFLRGTVTIDRQVQTAKGGAYLCEPKTEASHRTVPLAPETVEALSRHLAEHPPVTMTLPVGAAPPAGEPDVRERVTAEFLFGQKMFTREALTRAWHRATAGLDGLPDRSGWHALRHFYASVLIYGGENVKVVQARMGHKSAMETLDTYGHLWPDNEDTTRAVVGEAMRDLLGDGEQSGERSPSVPQTPRKRPSRTVNVRQVQNLQTRRSGALQGHSRRSR